MKTGPYSRVALLLLGSGFAALAYQQVWFRLFRGTFGASTPATAAVMAIFMAGLGLGGLLLGRRVDRSENPLRLYGYLELGVALSTALTPLLLRGVQAAYLATGGSHTLGLAPATLLRLALAVVVLGLPTFLMGGTLPAATRAVSVADDLGRSRLGVLYGANTAGAVLGTLWATFLAFEQLGLRGTLWLAAAVNLLVALIALRLAGTARRGEGVPETTPASAEVQGPAAPAALVLSAAAVVGFAFFLMELVWYRMLGPLLGGSSYTFGLILAVALAGIGIGGFLYGRRPAARRPDLSQFAATCALEALFLALPFMAGDTLAELTQSLRGLLCLGYGGLVVSWTAVTAVVVFVPALIAGYQFPLLVALLGSGRQEVGRQVGQAYAFNTLGSIAGSLAGGFGLLPLLGAPGLWRAAVLLLAGVASLFMAFALRRGSSRRAGAAILLLALMACGVLCVRGPSAVWRHTGIGAGRWSFDLKNWNDWRSLDHATNRAVAWEADGIETSIAVTDANGYAFVISGKVDGHAVTDAPTQVGAPLVGAMLHPAPRRAFVIGLGTGSSAGWLAEVPGMEEVQVAELEPALDHVAAMCAPVNEGVLENERVRLLHGDGRELLLTAPGRFDLIFSEPSNPYRAGIASLYTEDFYRLAAGKLAEDGIFLQWVQAYAVGTETIASIYATMDRVFPVVETWELSQDADLLLVASMRPIRHDLAEVQRRSAVEPYRTWLQRILGVEGARGFYAGHIGTPAIASQLAAQPFARVNTDDRPVVEFQFVRSLGRSQDFSVRALAAAAEEQDQDLPAVWVGPERAQLRELRALRAARQEKQPPPGPGASREEQVRTAARAAWLVGDMQAVIRLWTAQDSAPKGPFDQWMLAEALAWLGAPEALPVIEQASASAPGLRPLLLARWHARQGEAGQARQALLVAVPALQEDPWLPEAPLRRSLELTASLAGEDSDWDRAMFAALGPPFVVRRLEEERLRARMRLAAGLGVRDPICLEVLGDWEPWVPWTEPFLAYRQACYASHQSPLAPVATEDLLCFREHGSVALSLGSP